MAEHLVVSGFFAQCIGLLVRFSSIAVACAEYVCVGSIQMA